jgi:hypothetical protein
MIYNARRKIFVQNHFCRRFRWEIR